MARIIRKNTQNTSIREETPPSTMKQQQHRAVDSADDGLVGGNNLYFVDIFS